METEVIIQCSGRNAEERFTVDFGKIFKGDKGDAGEGVPAGGRTGQVLKKKSDGDYDTTWGDDEGITDIAPGAVGTKEIADNAVTESKLTKGVRDNINGKLNKTEISTEPTASTVIRRDNNGRAKVATPEADDDIANKQYVDAQKIKEPEKAGNFVVLDANGMPVPSNYKPASFRKASDKIQTNDIAEKTITLPKLGDDVAAKLNGYASKEDVAAVANVATRAASAATDAQTSADAAANAAIAAGSIAQTAKETAESAQTAADGAVRFDAAQELMVEQMEQALLNLGLKFMVITNNETGKVFSEERRAKLEQAEAVLFNTTNFHKVLLRGDDTSVHTKFVALVDSSRYYEATYNKSTYILSGISSSRIIDSNAVRYNVAQSITTSQQGIARTNIAAMANTPSGDPMHYIYETAGAEWIPYAEISTEGLEDWQVETLNMTQAQADGGVWWHNDIFVTVEQNRINYVLTIGNYSTQLSTYNLYLTSSTATTNYKEYNRSGFSPISATDACRSTLCKTIYFPAIKVTSFLRSFSNNSRLYRILGILNISTTNTSISGMLNNSPNLRDVNISGLNANLDLSTNVNLNVASVAYMITNADTASFTITLAPAVYAAAMADSDVQAALAAKPNVTLANAGATGGEN